MIPVGGSESERIRYHSESAESSSPLHFASLASDGGTTSPTPALLSSFDDSTAYTELGFPFFRTSFLMNMPAANATSMTIR